MLNDPQPPPWLNSQPTGRRPPFGGPPSQPSPTKRNVRVWVALCFLALAGLVVIVVAITSRSDDGELFRNGLIGAAADRLTPLGCVIGSTGERDCTEIRMIERACKADLSKARVRDVSAAAPAIEVTWTDGLVPVGQIIIMGAAAGEGRSGVTILSDQSGPCSVKITLNEWVALTKPGTRADLPAALR